LRNRCNHADTDVRLFRDDRAQMTAKPRLFRLARLLLKGIRPLFFCVGLALMSACILPLAPEFQDPPAAQNYAPRIIESNPEAGSIVTSQTFRVVVTDPNLGDALHVRWVVDYPPFSQTNTRTLVQDLTVPASVTGMPLMQEVSVDVDCVVNVLAQIPQHQVTVIVADSEFLAPVANKPVDLGRVAPGRLTTTASWLLNLECR
jgi:hypothetical protein